jgi:hypothetical protein
MRSFVIAVLVAIVVATGFAAALNLFQKTADTEWVYACSDCFCCWRFGGDALEIDCAADYGGACRNLARCQRMIVSGGRIAIAPGTEGTSDRAKPTESDRHR